jgi:hypothetical protein
VVRGGSGIKEDQEFVATVLEFPSLSWLDEDQFGAVRGIERLVSDVIDELAKSGEPMPLKRPVVCAVAGQGSICQYAVKRGAGFLLFAALKSETVAWINAGWSQLLMVSGAWPCNQTRRLSRTGCVAWSTSSSITEISSEKLSAIAIGIG